MKLMNKLKKIVSGIGGKKNIWRRAFSVSCLFHITVILTVGAMAAGFHQEIQRPAEQLIDVNLADTPEQIAKAEAQKSPLSRLKQMIDSPSKTEESPSESKSIENNNPSNNSNSQDNPADKSTADDTGGMSSPDGILPGGTEGQGNENGQSGAVSPGSGAAESEAAEESAGGSDNSGGSGESGDGGAQTESLDSLKARFAGTVESNKQYPHFAVRMNQQGTVLVQVTLGADGSLQGASVVGSVNGNLDKAALNAVYASTPFPHGVGSSVTMTVPVSFYLN